MGFLQVGRPSLPEGIPSFVDPMRRRVLRIYRHFHHLAVERLLLRKVTYVLLWASFEGPVRGTLAYDLAIPLDLRRSQRSSDVRIGRLELLVGLLMSQG